jgi:hypothetical protein
MAVSHSPIGHGKLKPGLSKLAHNAAGPRPMPAPGNPIPPSSQQAASIPGAPSTPAALPPSPPPALVRQDPGMIQ